MKASQALRIGATKVEGQTTGDLYTPVGDKACALGCILIGLGVPKDESLLNSTAKMLDQALPDVQAAIDKYGMIYKQSLFTDNDEAGLTLEAIAIKLAGIGE